MRCPGTSNGTDISSAGGNRTAQGLRRALSLSLPGSLSRFRFLARRVIDAILDNLETS